MNGKTLSGALKVLGVLAVSTLLPAVGAAQEPPQPPPDPLALVARFLDLTPVQAGHLQEAVQGMTRAMHDVEEALQAKQRELANLADAPHPDLAAVGKALLEMRAIGRQAEAIIATYHQTFHGLLTSEQLAKVQAVTFAAALTSAVQAFAALRLVNPPAPVP